MSFGVGANFRPSSSAWIWQSDRKWEEAWIWQSDRKWEERLSMALEEGVADGIAGGCR